MAGRRFAQIARVAATEIKIVAFRQQSDADSPHGAGMREKRSATGHTSALRAAPAFARRG